MAGLFVGFFGWLLGRWKGMLAALAAPDGRLHLTMLDVGGGDALLIQTQMGATCWSTAAQALTCFRTSWATACRREWAGWNT